MTTVKHRVTLDPRIIKLSTSLESAHSRPNPEFDLATTLPPLSPVHGLINSIKSGPIPVTACCYILRHWRGPGSRRRQAGDSCCRLWTTAGSVLCQIGRSSLDVLTSRSGQALLIMRAGHRVVINGFCPLSSGRRSSVSPIRPSWVFPG